MGNTAKTDNFLKAIRRHVSAQKKQMLSEVSQIKEETLTLTRSKAEQDSEKLIADRLEQKRTEQTSVLAKRTQDGQRALFLKRAEMTAKLLGRNLMPGTISKAWIIDRKPLGLQKPGQFPRIRTGSIQAQSQRIEADARQIGIEGCHAAAGS